MKTEHPQIRLTLEVLPDCRLPEHIRLRELLKFALRNTMFRLVPLSTEYLDNEGNPRPVEERREQQADTVR